MKKIVGIISACAVTFAVTATAAYALTADGPTTAPAAHAASPLEQAIRVQHLRKLGIEPDSSKARILDKWAETIRTDPDIAASMPGGTAGAGLGLIDPATGTAYIRNGLPRLSAAERSEFFGLLVGIYDRSVPQDCFGLTDPQEIMRRAISFGSMSDAQTDTYFRLIYRMIHQAAINAPVDIPTPQAHQASVVKLGASMEAQLHGNTADVNRLAAIVVDQAHASANDHCWLMGLSLHAIMALPDADRDVVLRQMYAAQMKNATPAGAPAVGASAASAASEPAAMQSAGARPLP
jgi:hypothetical protein